MLLNSMLPEDADVLSTTERKLSESEYAEDGMKPGEVDREEVVDA